MRQGDAKFWARSCLQKKAMKLEHAVAVVERAKAEGSFLRHYLCEICCRYHVTKQKLEKPKQVPVKKTIKWISISEKLPTDKASVKVLLGSLKVVKAVFMNGMWVKKGSEEVLSDVNFWQELT